MHLILFDTLVHDVSTLKLLIDGVDVSLFGDWTIPIMVKWKVLPMDIQANYSCDAVQAGIIDLKTGNESAMKI